MIRYAARDRETGFDVAERRGRDSSSARFSRLAGEASKVFPIPLSVSLLRSLGFPFASQAFKRSQDCGQPNGSGVNRIPSSPPAEGGSALEPSERAPRPPSRPTLLAESGGLHNQRLQRTIRVESVPAVVRPGGGPGTFVETSRARIAADP